jgi:hypothetical protein
LIKFLKQRGEFIMQQKYDEALEIEKKIMEYKEAKIKDLIRPVDAFITFEEVDGKYVASKFKRKFTFWGSKLPS